MINYNRPYGAVRAHAAAPAASAPPLQGYWQPGYQAPNPPSPVGPPVVGPDQQPKGFGPLILLDLGKMVAHPIQTLKSVFLLTGDLIALLPHRHLTLATS